MTLLAGAALVKTGAEGVFCAAVPGRDLGVALKCDDGFTRAAEAMMAAVLARLFPKYEEALRRWTYAAVPTRRGVTVGEVRVVAAAFAGLS
jgi:L-asparaginase II